MAELLKTQGLEATTALVTMYTVPALTDTMVFQILCSNKSSTDTPVITVKWNDGSLDHTIIDNYAIPIGSSEDVLAVPKKILNAGHLLKIQSSINTAIDVSIDYVEIS